MGAEAKSWIVRKARSSAKEIKGGDARTIAETTAAGAGIGVAAGAAAKNIGMGAGIGAAAGAAAGLAEVLLTRGPDAVLAKGSTIEMILDRPISFTSEEIPMNVAMKSGHFSDGASGPLPSVKQNSTTHRLPY